MEKDTCKAENKELWFKCYVMKAILIKVNCYPWLQYNNHAAARQSKEYIVK